MLIQNDAWNFKKRGGKYVLIEKEPHDKLNKKAGCRTVV